MTDARPLGYDGPVGREIVTAPTTPLFALDELRARLRVAFTDEDTQIEAFAEAALAQAESHLGRCVLPQTWRWWYDTVPCGRVIVLPEPVRSVVAVKSYSTDDDVTGTVLTSTEYAVDVRRDRLILDEATTLWPPATVREHNGWSVEATVGYASAVTVPMPIRQAVALLVQASYLREAPPAAAWTLLAPYRYRMGVA